MLSNNFVAKPNQGKGMDTAKKIAKASMVLIFEFQ